MPKIIPIRDLKDTASISNLCHETNEPIFVTKNGYGNLVIMSFDVYEKNMLMQDVYQKIEQAEQDISNGNVQDAKISLSNLKVKYGL